MMAFVLEWLATASAALFAGGALYVAVVEHPARLEAGLPVALAQFGGSYRRAAPWQASSAALCLITGILASVATSGWTWALGGLVTGSAIPFTLLVMRQTNRRLLTPQNLTEAEAVRLLGRWGRLHWLRSGLGAAGLATLVWAAVGR